MKRRHSRLLFWGAVTLAVPPAYVSSFLAEGGPPMAEGCSGSSPIPTEPGFSSVWLPPGPIPVGRDGFFVFNASGYSVSADEVPDAIEFEIRNEAGELIPGEVEHFISTLQPSPVVQSTFQFGWHATEPLDAGQSLRVRFSIRDSDPDVSAETTLTVTNATAELVQPPLEFREWTGETLDVGQGVSCPNGSMSSCGTDPIHSFGVDLERSVSVALVAAARLDPAVMTLWQYEVSEVPGKGTLREPLLHEVRLSHYEAAPVLNFLPRFSDALEEYCLRVTVRDLRTDASLSRDWCSRPPSPMPEVTFDRIKACASVTPEYLPRWCAGRDPGFSASCTATGGAGAGGSFGGGVAGTDSVPAGAGGASAGSGVVTAGGASAGSGVVTAGGGGRADGPPVAGRASSEAGSGATSGETAADAEPTTVLTEAGCGCRVAHRGAEREAWFSLLGLAAFRLVRGRRRARR